MTDAERLVMLLTDALNTARQALAASQRTLADGTRLAPMLAETGDVVMGRVEDALAPDRFVEGLGLKRYLEGLG